MVRKIPSRQKSSASSQSISQDDGILELFQNSLGPSEFFVKRDARIGAVTTGAKDVTNNPGDKSTAVDAAKRLGLSHSNLLPREEEGSTAVHLSSRKRKRGSEKSVPEDRYLERLARDEKQAIPSKAALSTREIPTISSAFSQDHDAAQPLSNSNEVSSDDFETNEAKEPPTKSHGLQSAPRPEHEELQKSSRTVFLANVSTSAISSKSDRKVLMSHLTSFRVDAKDGRSQCTVESIRFRSTPYSDSKLPRKAAFVKQALMDSTAKSTHAYAVYDSSNAARAAVRHLNGSTVLDRHLRVDSVAHPMAQDYRRCIFVGNIGFVDDETAMQNASGDPDTKRSAKPSADVGQLKKIYEEGLWRTFGQCGKVENVRLVRAQTNQVGKGFAYVQFEDANAVEKALLHDGKKFLPLLPRKLRVLRAKKVLPNAKAERTRGDETAARPQGRRDKAGAGSTNMGRASKLYGRAGAAQRRRGTLPSPNVGKPSTIFEGQRATSDPGMSKGRKLGKKKNGRSERAASFKRQRLRQ